MHRRRPPGDAPRRRTTRTVAAVIGTVLSLGVGTALAAQAQAADRVRVSRGIVYVVDHGRPQRLDVYLPGRRPHRSPAVIFVHGGAWVRGGRTHWGSWPTTLTRQTGWPSFTIDYTLSSPDPARDEPADVQAAVRWVKQRAGRYGIDPDRLALVGESAGGHLVQLAGTRPPAADRTDRVAAVVSLSGFSNFPLLAVDAMCTRHSCDGRLPVGRWTPVRPQTLLAAQLVQDGLLRTGYHEDPALWRALSPISHVDRGDAAMLLISSSDELTPVDQDASLAASLAAHHEPVSTIVVPGQVHAMGLRPAVAGEVTRWLRASLSSAARRS